MSNVQFFCITLQISTYKKDIPQKCHTFLIIPFRDTQPQIYRIKVTSLIKFITFLLRVVAIQEINRKYAYYFLILKLLCQKCHFVFVKYVLKSGLSNFFNIWQKKKYFNIFRIFFFL